MAKKFALLFAPLFLSLVLNITGQVASPRYTLRDFKNPNEFLHRPGLIRFSPDHSLLAVSGRTADVIVYDVATGKLISKIDGKGFSGFSFFPGRNEAIVRGNDFKIRIFDLSSGAILRELKGMALTSDDGVPNMTQSPAMLEMAPIDLSPDRSRVLTVRGSRTSELVDLGTGNPIYQFRNPDKSRAGIMMLKAFYGFEASFVAGLTTLKQETSFTAEGRYVLVSNMSRTATLWDVGSGQLVATFGPLKNTIVNEAFSPDGRLLATTDAEGITMIWSIPEGKLLSTIGSEKDSNYIAAWSPDSREIWTIAYKEDARGYDASSGKLIKTLVGSKALGVAYSPSGRLILTRSTDKQSIGSIWDPKTGELVGRIEKRKEDEYPYRLFFDPKERWVISASKKAVSIWDFKGTLKQNLENAVFPATFSEDGKTLVTGGRKDTGYVWTVGD